MNNTYIFVSLAAAVCIVLFSFNVSQAPEEVDVVTLEDVVFESKENYSDEVEDKKFGSVEGGVTQDLRNQGLTTVSKNIFNRKETENLLLSGNKFTGALPAEVRHLQKLRVLDLSNNDFTGVPAEVGQLQALEVLDLSGNPITGLPLEIGALQSLKILDVRDTNYSEYDLGIIQSALPTSVEILIN